MRLIPGLVIVLLNFGFIAAQEEQVPVWQEPWEGVPHKYRLWDYPELEFPASAQEWAVQRLDIRAVLLRLLGDVPARPEQLDVRTLAREEKEGFILEKFVFDNGVDSLVPGYLLIPERQAEPGHGAHGAETLFGFDGG